MKKLQLIFPLILVLLLVGCGGYVKEKGNWVYVTYDEAVGRRVQEINADNDTFVIIDSKLMYAKDKNSVYYERSIIENADPETFRIINKEGYSKDANYVFLDGMRIIDANPKTFVCLGFPYSKDDKHVYCGNLPMNVKNIEEFKVTEQANTRYYSDTEFFLRQHPDYPSIDSSKYYCVVISNEGKGETKDQKFEGYREIR